MACWRVGPFLSRFHFRELGRVRLKNCLHIRVSWPAVLEVSISIEPHRLRRSFGPAGITKPLVYCLHRAASLIDVVSLLKPNLRSVSRRKPANRLDKQERSRPMRGVAGRPMSRVQRECNLRTLSPKRLLEPVDWRPVPSDFGSPIPLKFDRGQNYRRRRKDRPIQKTRLWRQKAWLSATSLSAEFYCTFLGRRV